MELLRIEGLSKRYWLHTKTRRELWALHDVSLTLQRGSIVGIIGPNGAGKTTLLKVLARVTPPTTGHIVGRGRVVPLLALGAGFQADLSGRENVILSAALYGIARDDVERRMDDILAFSGVEEFIDVPVRRYSSGMYLRLAFSVAINMDPDILLADEVLAVGDIEFQERCLERVQRSGREGLGVLFVSHDMAAITRLCDHVLWLNAGEVVRQGPPAEIVAAYQQSAWTAVARTSRGRGDRRHATEQGEIVFVKLLSDDGREIGAVRVADSLQIQMGLRFLRPGLRIRCIVDVFARGATAFRSPQPEEIVVDEGLYTATLTIPPHLLSETTYTVNLIVHVHDGNRLQTPLTWYNAVSFPVYGVTSGISARGTFPTELNGVLSPILDWQMTRATPPDAASSEG